MKRLDIEKHKDNYIKMGTERGAPGPGRCEQNGGRGHASWAEGWAIEGGVRRQVSAWEPGRTSGVACFRKELSLGGGCRGGCRGGAGLWWCHLAGRV